MATEIMTAQIPLTPLAAVSLTSSYDGGNWLWSVGPFSAPTHGWRIDLTGSKQANIIAMQFYADSDSPTNRFANFDVFGVRKDTEATPDEKTIYLGEFELRTGSGGGTGGFFGGTAYVFVDKITPLIDATNSPPGARVLGDVDNMAAELQFDTSGFIALIIHAKEGTPDSIASLGLFWTVN